MTQPYQPLELRQREAYENLWKECPQSSSDQSFLILLGWSGLFGYEAAWDNDLVWLRQTRPEALHLPPAGSWENQDWEKRLIEQVGPKARFVTVPEHLALIWSDQLGHKIAIEEDRNSFEYLYRAGELETLAGNRHMRRRNKINQFRRHHKSVFVPLSDELIDPILALQARWLTEQALQPGSKSETLLRTENDCIRLALAHWKEFGLVGGAVAADGQLIAYTLAEPVPDGSLQVHFEKGLAEYDGSYQVVNQDFAVFLNGRYELLNREEDMGDPGLRHAKLAYSPTMFLRKYTVLWDAEATEGHPAAFPVRGAVYPENPAQPEPTEPAAAESTPVEPQPRQVTWEEVFDKAPCKSMQENFEARKQCKVWQSVEAGLDEWIEAQGPEAVRISDDLAAHPELSGGEVRSSEIFASLLARHGFAVEQPFMEMPTAFMARKTLGHGGPVVAFLVEYDALPDVGHGCGHNLHGTVAAFAGMGLAHVLERHRCDATVWVIGTPAEETWGGKIPMASGGVFDGVTLALMFHCTTGMAKVASRFLALDGWQFDFSGKPAHSSGAPWKGRSALNGLRLFLNALDMMRLHMMPSDRLHSVITDGDGAINVIAPKASCRVETRAVDRPRLDSLNEMVLAAAKGAALATGTSVTWNKFMPSFDDMLPNLAAEELAFRVLDDMGIPVAKGEELDGSSDIGNVSYRCPAIHPLLSICQTKLPAHTAAFAEATVGEDGHKALLTGIRALARIGGRVAIDPALAALIWQDFEGARAAQVGPKDEK